LELPDLPVLKVLLDLLDPQVVLDPPALKVLLDLLDPQAVLELKEQWVLQVQMVAMELKEQWVLQV
jgi:hypothetical protein